MLIAQHCIKLQSVDLFKCELFSYLAVEKFIVRLQFNVPDCAIDVHLTQLTDMHKLQLNKLCLLAMIHEMT